MRNVFIFLLAGFLLVSVNLLGQKKLYFCSDYTSTGEPVGTSSVWSISSKGGNVYMVYKNGGANILSGVIYIFIDKLNSANEYKEYATKTLVPYKFMNWALYDYKFTEAGEYKVKFLDDLYAELATEYVTIKMKDETVPTTTTSTTGTGEKVDMNYYTGTKIYLCENVSAEGDPITPSEVFNIPPAGAYTYVLVNAYKELKTTQFVVDVYTGDNYKDFVETKYIEVTPTSKWSYFKYSFYKAGKFKISVFNKDWVPVGSSYVTINVK
jgi:hypothetical protein